MGDDLILLALFYFLYVSDSYFLLHKHSIAFREMGKGHCRVILPSSNAGNRDRALHMFSLFPPLRSTYISNLVPVSLSEKGILAYVSQSFATSGRPRQSLKVIEYDEIHSIKSDGTNLLINSEHFVNCQISEHATLISRTVNELINPNGKVQSLTLQELIHSVFNVNIIRQIMAEYRKLSIPLRVLCNTIFFVMFILFPVLSRWKGLVFSLLFILSLLGILLPMLCVSFYSLHKRFSIGSRWDRIGCIIRFIICPPCAIRANDLISRFLVAKFHPASVAIALCSKSDALEFIRMILRDLKNPLRKDVNEDLSLSIDEEWRNKMIVSVEGSTQQSEIEFKELQEVLLKSAPSMLAVCPRCLVQFSALIDSCPDCVGIAPMLLQTIGDTSD